MGSLLRRIFSGPVEQRDNETTPLAVTDWAKQFRPGANVNFNGRNYQGFQLGTLGPGSAHYENNAVVFACEAKRVAVFSEARFQWQQLQNGRPGDLFGTAALRVLEEPWPGATTRDLLAVAELDVAMRGNSYWVRDDLGYLLRLNPDNVKILFEAVNDDLTGQMIGERIIGYAYIGQNRRIAATFTPREVAHYKPIPGTSQFLGQSWLTPCLSDIDADASITEHKRVQLKTGANLSYVVSLDPSVTDEQFDEFVDLYRQQHEGAHNSGKTLFLGGGAQVKTIGQTFENLSLKATQGATETRIAACAGVHPVVVGLSEGMQGSSLNAGNYGAAKRNFVDGTIRPLWGAFAGAFQWLLNVPASSRLWYDDRDIAFLREDVLDQAQILAKDAQTIRQLVDAGFTPSAVVDAVKANDLHRIMANHSGLFSVQLQKPGEKLGANGTTPTTEDDSQ